MKSLALALALLVLFGSWMATSAQVVIDNKKDREVGLKEMEIFDKGITPSVVKEKQTILASIERDYNEKISTILSRLTSPAAKNVVTTHVDVGLLDPNFDSKVRASQNVTVSIILGKDGIESSWGEHADRKIVEVRRLIGTTFRIPEERISIMVAPY